MCLHVPGTQDALTGVPGDAYWQVQRPNSGVTFRRAFPVGFQPEAHFSNEALTAYSSPSALLK